MRALILAASALAAGALLTLTGRDSAMATQCVGDRELAASAAVNFVGHVVTIERGRRAAVVVVDSVAAGRGLRAGDRVRVLDTSPPRAETAGKLVLGARYRFRPSRGARPFEINGCSAERLSGFVLPPTAVPDWVIPAMGSLFVLGCAVGGWFVRRTGRRQRGCRFARTEASAGTTRR